MNQKKSKAGLENQRDIPRVHIGFYTQYSKGLENQRHRHRMGNQRHAQAFTLRATQGWGTRENLKSAHRLLHSMWQRAGVPETPWHAQAFTLRVAQGWGTRETFWVCTQAFMLNAAQERWNQWNLLISTSLHSYEEHASVTSHVFRMRDLEHIGLKRRGFFFFRRIFNVHVITNAIHGMLSNHYFNVY